MRLQIKRAALLFIVALVMVSILPMTAFAAVTPVTGISVDGSGASLSGTTVTGSQSGSLSNATGTMTVTYTGTEEATVSYTYTVSTSGRGGTVTLNSASITGSGTVTQTMNQNDVITYTLTSAKFGGVTLTLSNFSVTVNQAGAKATVTYDSAKGSVTLGGTAVSNGEAATVSGGTIAVAATPASGCSFLGWVNADTHEIMSAKTTDTLNVPQDTNIEAVFVNTTSDTAWFGVGAATSSEWSSSYFDPSKQTYYTVSGFTHMYDSLNDAAATAASNGKYVVLMNNGTLSGSHTIPSGVTLLIPFDSGNTLYTANPVTIMSYTTPSVYRKLTMNSGASITVNGAMSLSAQISYTTSKINEGSPTGPVSFVDMQSGSSITVNNGGALYAWGFITGSGTVTANNGASVYECFQFMDYRGGGQSTESEMKSYDIFPLSQYYVQNIEVPLTLNYGAKEYAHAVICAKPLTEYYDYCSTINFIGTSGSMFNLSSGTSITKQYSGTSDRLLVDVNGSISLSSISLQIDQDKTISSAEYDLPINSNMTININSGTATINQDIALLPGSQINIASGATVTMGSGYNLFVYDADQWEEFVYAEGYSGTTYNQDGAYHNVLLRPLSYAPGRASGVTRTNADLVDTAIKVNGTLDGSAGYIYTTCGPMTYKEGPTVGAEYTNHYVTVDSENRGGANIYSTASTGKVILTSGSTTEVYQVIQDPWHNGSDTDDDYYIAIPVSSAKLQNKVYNDNDLPLYTTTAGSSNTTYNYSAEHGRWDDADENGNSHIITSEVKDATCESAGYTIYTCSCGYSYADNFTAPHSNENCEHNLDNLFGIYGTSVRAGDSLGMYFYVKKEDLPNANGGKTTSGTYYAKVIHAKADGTTETVTDIAGELYQDAYYRFYFTGVAAKEMADMVYVSIYDNSDTLVSNVYSESVENYAVSLLGEIEKTGEDPSGRNALLQQTLVDMLYYGAACQTYFGYNTDELATRNISTYTPSSGTISYGEDISNDDTVKAYCLDQSVTVESSLIFSFYFQNIDRTKGIDVSFTDHYGSSKSPEITVTDLGENKYRVDVHGLAVADGYAGNATISCKVTTSDGAEITAKGRISDYAKAAAEAFPDQKDVFERLMYFAASAYEYLHKVIESA